MNDEKHSEIDSLKIKYNTINQTVFSLSSMSEVEKLTAFTADLNIRK